MDQIANTVRKDVACNTMVYCMKDNLYPFRADWPARPGLSNALQ